MDKPELRCLDDMTVMAARVALRDRDAVRIPYICQMTGEAKELLVISRDAAERMVVATKGAVTLEEARILALVHISQLCETDVHEVVGIPPRRSVSILEDLTTRGLAVKHPVGEVSFYAQNRDDVHLQFTDLALGAAHG